MTSGSSMLVFLLVDTPTHAVWLKSVHDFRDAVIHMMDCVIYLLAPQKIFRNVSFFTVFSFSFCFTLMVNFTVVYNHLVINVPVKLTLEIFQISKSGNTVKSID